MEDEAATATGALGAARDASGMEGGDRVERMELSDEDMSGIRTPSGLGLAEEAINTSTDPAPVPAAAVAISGTEQELESGNGGGGDATNAVDGPIPPEVGPETRDSGADETATGAAEKEVDAGEVEPDATAEKDDAAEETTRPQDSPSKAPGAVGRPSLRPRKIAVPFSMPVHLQRVSVKYGEPAVEYHGTVYHLEGWPTAESVMVVFDDGDTHRFSAIDVRGCMNAGGWALLDATSHWHGKGCVQGVECSQVAGIIAIKPPRSKKAKLEGIWIGTSIAVPGERQGADLRDLQGDAGQPSGIPQHAVWCSGATGRRGHGVLGINESTPDGRDARKTNKVQNGLSRRSAKRGLGRSSSMPNPQFLGLRDCLAGSPDGQAHSCRSGFNSSHSTCTKESVHGA